MMKGNENGSGLPAWADEIRTALQKNVSHAFILHGNIHDYPVPRRVMLQDYLARLFGERKVAFFSRARGFRFPDQASREAFARFAPPDPFAQGQATLPSDPASAMGLIETFLREEENGVVIVQDPAALFPAGDWSVLSQADRTVISHVAAIGRDLRIGARGHAILILAENLEDVHPEVRGARFLPVRIPLPSQSERLEFIRWFLSSEPVPFASGFSPEKLANATGGLGRIQVDDILLRSSGEECSERFARERKDVLFESVYAGVLTPIEPGEGFSGIAGYEYAKKAFLERIIEPISRGELERVPMGVLLVGPPGTGKSLFVRCLAAEIGFQAVELNIGGQIASKYQGEGERNLARAIFALESLAPTLCFIDEIDQAIRRGEGEQNMQETRLCQMTLKFMADTRHRGKVIIVGATNRPDLMDAALKRPGRFDLKIPFFTPDVDERAAIFALYACRLKIADLAFPIGHTEGWTGAEIEALCRKAQEIQLRGEKEDVWGEALRRFRPTTQDIALMTRLALEEVNDLDYLPELFRKKPPKEAEEVVRRARAG